MSRIFKNNFKKNMTTKPNHKTEGCIGLGCELYLESVRVTNPTGVGPKNFSNLTQSNPTQPNLCTRVMVNLEKFI